MSDDYLDLDRSELGDGLDPEDPTPHCANLLSQAAHVNDSGATAHGFPYRVRPG